MRSVKEQKNELRKHVLNLRLQTTVDEWLLKSDQIQNHLLSHSLYGDAEVIHCYVSMNERKEVNTGNLIQRILKDGKKVVVPVTDFKNHNLSHSLITTETQLVPNKWGVSEPDVIIEVDSKDLDLIIIPMAAADRKGNRLGYGKGFYDRFLSGTTAVKVGLVFSDYIFDEIPTEQFDEKLDVIISEKGVISVQH